MTFSISRNSMDAKDLHISSQLPDLAPLSLYLLLFTFLNTLPPSLPASKLPRQIYFFTFILSPHSFLLNKPNQPNKLNNSINPVNPVNSINSTNPINPTNPTNSINFAGSPFYFPIILNSYNSQLTFKHLL